MSGKQLQQETDEILSLKRKKAAQAKAEAEKKEPRTYTVQPGDNLSKISQEVYGDANRWREIFEANKDQIEKPSLIRPGQKLRIPEPEQEEAAAQAPEPAEQPEPKAKAARPSAKEPDRRIT